MLINEREALASILQATAEILDIPDSVYEDVTLKYEDICEHLTAEDSDLHQYKPQLYTQGSFRLGTVIHPIHKDDEYDIDLVCRLEITKEAISQKDLKNKIGQRLKARADLEKILEESRRCWVLNYPSEKGQPSFHMDVLPSIPNEERLPNGLLLTDKDLTRWQKSNPITYAEWFKVRMAFDAKKSSIAALRQASIEDIPDWQVKTSLQRSVQILKRHRDIYFQNKGDLRPASIILTTLAARAYQNEEDVFDALTSITKRMPQFIEYKNGRWRVENPVENEENFADKWNDYPERREAFLVWLKKVETDFSELPRKASLDDGLNFLEKSLGNGTIAKVAAKLGVKSTRFLPMVVPSSQVLVPAVGDSSHAQSPKWQIVPQYKVSVSADVYNKIGLRKGKRQWAVSDRPVPKNVWLRFVAKCNVPEPFSIKWQVVNTGKDALQANALRGDFYESEDTNKQIRWESTSYQGTHWVEAFVIKNGICVARSGKIFVKVR